LVVLLPGCAQEKPCQVAATTLPVYQFTAAICQGTDIQVKQLITQQVSCLHDYSLNVSQVRTIETAEVVVISGGGLEEFMEDTLHNANRVIDSSLNVPMLECEDHHDHEHDTEGHHHDQDAHIWLSPNNARIMAHNIAEGLTKAYPQYADRFSYNLSMLDQQFDALEEYGQRRLADLSCRELITFHDGFGYFAAAFDLHILEAIEEESGSEASAKELKEMVTLVREHQLPAVFTEVSGSASAAGIIAAETGSKVYSLDMAMAGQDYFEAMYHNIDTIREAMK
jgi:ABC-type Zn uptake system ZnuABC Zn-binding protein ZnuA